MFNDLPPLALMMQGIPYLLNVRRLLDNRRGVA
jgi:hypothetical protein